MKLPIHSAEEVTGEWEGMWYHGGSESVQLPYNSCEGEWSDSNTADECITIDYHLRIHEDLSGELLYTMTSDEGAVQESIRSTEGELVDGMLRLIVHQSEEISYVLSCSMLDDRFRCLEPDSDTSNLYGIDFFLR